MLKKPCNYKAFFDSRNKIKLISFKKLYFFYILFED